MACGTRLRTAILEALSASETELASLGDDPSGAIHECRRNNKRVRALLDLLRPCVDDATFQRARGQLKACSDLLARPRRAAALHQTLAKLPSSLDEGALLDLERDLAERPRGLDPNARAAARHVLGELAAVVETWPVEAVTDEQAKGRLKRSLERLSRCLKRVIAKPSRIRLHALRKRVKRCALQRRELRRLDVGVRKGKLEKLEKLGERLGTINDLYDLRDTLRSASQIDPRSRNAARKAARSLRRRRTKQAVKDAQRLRSCSAVFEP